MNYQPGARATGLIETRRSRSGLVGWRPASTAAMLPLRRKRTRKKGTRVEERLAKREQAVPLSSLLGWLNFSDGRPDSRWQKQVNDAYAFFAEQGEPTPWQALSNALTVGLRELHASAPAFRDVRQAETALALAGKVLTAYRKHHVDLLAHLDDRDLFTPFFLVRVFEAVLTVGVSSGADESTVGRRPQPPQRFRGLPPHRPVGDAAAG